MGRLVTSFNLNMPRGGQIDPPPAPSVVFFKNASFLETVEPWFFVNFLKLFRRYEEILCQY